LKDYTPGQDELSVSDGKSNFWLTVGPEDDSFKTTFGNRLEDDCVPEDNNNGGETCEENPNQEKCNQEEENNGGGGSGGSNRSGSRPTGNVLGDSTTDLPGQVLGATLAQTGTDVSPMIYLGMTMLGLLFITRRKAFKF
jgi:LPXTG-motif cell wall-anchored protein